ncbi:MAG: nucleotidyltransferase domain-containing protein [Armatimonadota bacterium]|nr:MAG: nucleotidyltransferase domain-containing protein [Armatimonadota bacterium]
MSARITIDREKIAEFCRTWKVVELALFGSVLREDFGAVSDVDVLVAFAPDARWSLFDMARMQQALEEIFDRKVDLVSKAGIETSRNPLRREAILASAEVIYVS